MRRLSILLPLAALSTAWAGDGAGELRKDDYPPFTLAKVQAMNPCRPAASYEVKDRSFSAEVVYQGAVRDVSGRRRELVRRWAAGLGDPKAAERYGREVSLSEGGRVHWLPVPDSLFPVLQSNLEPGDRATAYLVFVGCVGREGVFALDEFETLSASPDEQADVVVEVPAPFPAGQS